MSVLGRHVLLADAQTEHVGERKSSVLNVTMETLGDKGDSYHRVQNKTTGGNFTMTALNCCNVELQVL